MLRSNPSPESDVSDSDDGRAVSFQQKDPQSPLSSPLLNPRRNSIQTTSHTKHRLKQLVPLIISFLIVIIVIDKRVLNPLKYLFYMLISIHFPGYSYLCCLVSVRFGLEAFERHCENEMNKKFKSFSSFYVKYCAEIKFILFGNVGEYNFTESDNAVIMKHALDYYESEKILSGFPFVKPLPMLLKSVHHHGIHETNEEIMRHRIDEELYERWTSPSVMIFKFLTKVIVRSTNYFSRFLLKTASRILHFGANKIDAKLMNNKNRDYGAPNNYDSFNGEQQHMGLQNVTRKRSNSSFSRATSSTLKF